MPLLQRDGRGQVLLGVSGALGRGIGTGFGGAMRKGAMRGIAEQVQQLNQQSAEMEPREYAGQLLGIISKNGLEPGNTFRSLVDLHKEFWSQKQATQAQQAQQQGQAQQEQQQGEARIARQIRTGARLRDAGAPPWVVSAGITGDMDLKAGLGEVPEPVTENTDPGGATGILVDRLLAENPGMRFGDALHRVQTGFRQGYFLTNGAAYPIPGVPETKGRIRYGEKAGEQQAVRDNAAEIEMEKLRGSTAAKEEAALPVKKFAMESKIDSAGNLFGAVDRAREQASGWTTGLPGTILGYVPGTEAFNLGRTIDTIRANVGFDRLQEMRDMSPTGGALGQVSEQENRLLQSTIASLEQSQSREQFLRNLDIVVAQYRRSADRMRRAYETDVQRYGTEKMPAFFLDEPKRAIVDFSELPE